MPNPPRNTKARGDWPTSIRLPLDLKKDLKEEAFAKQWPVTLVIINVLKQWQAFRNTSKKSKRMPNID